MLPFNAVTVKNDWDESQVYESTSCASALPLRSDELMVNLEAARLTVP